jgi:serralysin
MANFVLLSGTIDTSDSFASGRHFDDYTLTTSLGLQPVTISMTSPTFDTFLQVFDAGTLMILADDDDNGAGSDALISPAGPSPNGAGADNAVVPNTLTSTLGTNYILRAQGFNAAALGDYMLQVTVPAGDVFINGMTGDLTLPPPSPTVSVFTPTPDELGPGVPTGVLPQPGVSGIFYNLTDSTDVVTLDTFTTGGLPVRALSGNDIITAMPGVIDINGNAGADDIFGSSSDDNVLRGGKGSDLVMGEFGNDVLNGNNNNDTVEGGEGDDTVRGGRENDLLFGGNGSDVLIGDRGQDQMTGGFGSDAFVLNGIFQELPTSVSAADIILDYEIGIDLIDIGGFAPASIIGEPVSLTIDGNPGLPSLAIRSGASYLGVIANVGSLSDLTFTGAFAGIEAMIG